MKSLLLLDLARGIADIVAVIGSIAAVGSLLVFGAPTGNSSVADTLGQPIFLASALTWAAITLIAISVRVTISRTMSDTSKLAPSQ